MKDPCNSPLIELNQPSHPQSYPQILWVNKNTLYITENYLRIFEEKSEKSCSTANDTIQLQLYGVWNHPAQMLIR